MLLEKEMEKKKEQEDVVGTLMLWLLSSSVYLLPTFRPGAGRQHVTLELQDLSALFSPGGTQTQLIELKAAPREKFCE